MYGDVNNGKQDGPLDDEEEFSEQEILDDTFSCVICRNGNSVTTYGRNL